MAAEGCVYDAHQVSEAFVKKYYHFVVTATHAAHQFYGVDSLVTRPGPDGTMMSFSSVEVKQRRFECFSRFSFYIRCYYVKMLLDS